MLGMAYVVVFLVLLPLIAVLVLSPLPGPTKSDSRSPGGKRWLRAWKWLFWSLIASDLTLFLLIRAIDRNEVIGHVFANIAFLIAIAFGVVSYIVARYVGRQPWAWALCGLLSMLPTPAQLAFGTLGSIAIRRTVSSPLRVSPLRIKVGYSIAVFLIVAVTSVMGIGQIVYETVKHAEPAVLGIAATPDRVIKTAREVFQEAGFDIEEAEFGDGFHARERISPSRYYSIYTIGSREGLTQLEVIRMDSKRALWSISMSSGGEMLQITEGARQLLDQVKARSEKGTIRR